MRYAKANMTIEDLKKKIETSSYRYGINYIIRLEDKVVKDLAYKIWLQYDYENRGLIEDDVISRCINGKLQQYEMINGFPVIWCYGCDGSDSPFVFIIYISDKDEFRAYVPTKGNFYYKSSEYRIGTPYSDDRYEDRQYDVSLLRKEVKNRIKVKI